MLLAAQNLPFVHSVPSAIALETCSLWWPAREVSQLPRTFWFYGAAVWSVKMQCLHKQNVRFQKNTNKQ